jgi:hypothetical protein
VSGVRIEGDLDRLPSEALAEVVRVAANLDAPIALDLAEPATAGEIAIDATHIKE